ncbi:hypothetical protein PanWU01x14_138240, partial [Parasponia andersonii]
IQRSKHKKPQKEKREEKKSTRQTLTDESQTNLNRQSIHIRSDCYKWSRAGPEKANNTGFSNWVLVRNAHIKLGSNKLTGLKFLETQFRVLVNFPSDSHYPSKKFLLLGQLEEFDRDLTQLFWV